jgi:hypothetical protein
MMTEAPPPLKIAIGSGPQVLSTPLPITPKRSPRFQIMSGHEWDR